MISKKLELFLESLTLGPALRRIYGILLRIVAIILVFFGLYYIIDMIMSLANAQLPTQVLGTIIAMLITIIGTILILLILLFRIQNVEDYPSQSYSVTHLCAQLLWLTGEIIAIFHLTTGLSTGIMYWFGSYPRLPYYDSLMWRLLTFAVFPPFISGLLAIVACILQAALSLIICYLLAELLLIIRDIALSNRR